MACQEERDPRPTQILLMLRITVICSRVWRHWMPRFLFYMYIYIFTYKKRYKQAGNERGQMEVAAIGDGQQLIPRTLVGGVGLPQAFQDGARYIQYVVTVRGSRGILRMEAYHGPP
jgi:hypothetical protein